MICWRFSPPWHWKSFVIPLFLLQPAKFRDEEMTFDTNQKRWENGPILS